MSTEMESLSPKARALADQLGHTGNIAEALKKDPSLVEGLDEYQKWRDAEHQAEGQRIGSNSRLQPMTHGVAETLKKLSPPKKRKKK
ncbi:MAG: hypothetical protein WCG02_03850 [Candidatus Taylorbacteria bacterium]